MRGFASAVAIALAVAVFAFAFASQSADSGRLSAQVLALESQVLHERSLDAMEMGDWAFRDALIDSGYAFKGCGLHTSDFCANLSANFGNYSIAAGNALGERLYSVNFTPALSCREAAAGADGFQVSYRTNYTLAMLANSSSVRESRLLANASTVDLNHTTEDVFQLRLRDDSGNELYYLSFACP
ncbi:hypothetical protein COX86_01980 [Candidatus Micrarchaeota archaeon CG_4_10_14_0_2_um_filter_60_11]|nr:MAG: hypothetical protein AUJ16_04545 [Candidatus Micrarchaeota archaeon CG1_02_60_51]PIN96385.1 MAG: hypothetical protein COU39_01395 [Candidatus Micrarchaeota archaeon CG10_big_fil_rev_8_21_14_0_10_60_32]PIY91800.1 MAG: hypothetical protein COY71_01210 [Candidatus Micrarchaeota archaeon CG_4_10_14_0_8_um_filter_60_7]PIZ90997.1 MAG: hypothetical protein COX86_01980 [Candidatus Micrarchaeota archaeon CG_4_10_14_0_2_um_filter_60_11]